MTVAISQIPADYVEAFEEALSDQFNNSAAYEAVQQHEVIAMLIEQVRDRNAYIQPNGELAYIQASREQIIAAIAYRENQTAAEQITARSPLVRILVFAVLAMLIVGVSWFMWHIRPSAQRARAEARTDALTQTDETQTPIVDPLDAEIPIPTLQPLPPVSQDALAAIGGNGESLTLGEPSLLEIIYGDGEVTALPISPAGLTEVGALRYQEEIMLSDTPVAVWVANTRLNYGIGIPHELVSRLKIGDRVTIFTNTGVETDFLVRELATKRSYETSDILKQNTIGLSLFALPALSDEDVEVAFAVYDVNQEQQLGQAVKAGNDQQLGNLTLVVDSMMSVDERSDGRIEVSISGTLTGELMTGQQVLLNVTTDTGQQTGTTNIQPGSWALTFALDPDAQGQRALAEFRLLPESDLVVIQLPRIPVLQTGMTTVLQKAWLDPATAAISITLVHHNAADNGVVWLAAEDILLTHYDGQPLASSAIPALPLQLGSGTSVTQTMTFIPAQPGAPTLLTVGEEQWEVSHP